MSSFAPLVALLGACRNPNCPNGCGIFFTKATPILPDTQCIICPCLAAQHLPSANEASSAGQTSAPGEQTVPSQPGGVSAGRGQAIPSSSAGSVGNPVKPLGVFGARGAPASASSSSNSTTNPLAGLTAGPDIFRQMLKNANRFNPAEKSLQDLHTAAPGGKKTKPAGAGSKKFTLVCLPFTSAIANETFRRPSANLVTTLAEASYIARISLHPTISNDKLYTLIQDHFRHIPEILEFGFQLLKMKSVKAGSSDLVVRLEMEFSYDAVLVATGRTGIRGCSASWPQIVYISLPSHGPDLAGSSQLPIPVESDTSTRTSSGKRAATAIDVSDSEDVDTHRRKQRKRTEPAKLSDSDDDDRDDRPLKQGRKRKAPEASSSEDSDDQAPQARSRNHRRAPSKAAGKKTAVPPSSSESSDSSDRTPARKRRRRSSKSAGKRKATEPPPSSSDDDSTTPRPRRKKARAAKKPVSDSDSDLPEPPTLSSAAKGKQKAKDEGTAFHNGEYDADFAAAESDDEAQPTAQGESGSSAEPRPMYPASHEALIRILANMSQPLGNRTAVFYASDPQGIFVAGLKSATLLSTFCDLLANPATSSTIILPSQMPDFIRNTLVSEFDPFAAVMLRIGRDPNRLVTTEVEKEFDELFFLGPGGVHGIMTHLDTVYIALYQLERRDYSTFAFRYSRSYWDPAGGFRDFDLFRDAHDSDLPRATKGEHDRLRLNLLITAIGNLDVDVALIQLIQTFGDAADSKQMNKDRILRGGQYGIGRVFDLLVAPFLDEHDMSRAGYADMLALLTKFFEAVVRILKNWQKSGGKKAPPSKAAPTAEASSSSTRNTRSQSRHQPTASSTLSDDDSASTLNDDPVAEPEPASQQPPPSVPPPSTTQSSAPQQPPRAEPAIESEDETDRIFRRAQEQWDEMRRRRAAAAAAAHARRYRRRQPSPQAGPSRPRPQPRPQRNQARANPVWIDPTALPADDLEDGRSMLNRSRFWSNLVRYILERFPHPEASRRVTVDSILSAGLNRDQQFRRLSLIYHPDRNMTQSSHFLTVAQIITQALNTARKSKAD
ncbi:hypothetical protein C8F01DRAFT_1375342 [Mycena amicta]|nr:hypothetical protein C8F01DRAFT_1375342 [Mycena amicta]